MRSPVSVVDMCETFLCKCKWFLQKPWLSCQKWEVLKKEKKEMVVKSGKDVGGLDSRVPLQPRFMQIYVCTSCIFGLHIRTPWFLPPQTHHLPKLKEWQEVFTCTLRVREEVVLTTIFIFSMSKLGEVVEFQCGSPSRFLLSSEDLFSPKSRPEKAPIFGWESHMNWFNTKPAR